MQETEFNCQSSTKRLLAKSLAVINSTPFSHRYLTRFNKIVTVKILSTVIVIAFLVSFFAFAMANAATSSTQTIHMVGSIAYPSPTPSPTATPNLNNHATVPNGWGYGSQASKYSTVTWEGQTAIKVQDYRAPYAGSMGCFDRELDSQMVPIKPGDTVTLKIWVYTEASTIGDNAKDSRHVPGVTMEIDPFKGSQRINAVLPVNGIGVQNTNADGSAYPGVGNPGLVNGQYVYIWDYVPWGTTHWTQLTMTWTVPSVCYGDGLAYTAGTAVTPDSFIAVIEASSVNPGSEGAAVYIYGTSLTIS